MHIPLVVALTMIAFATNSVLCRAALGEGAIDAASFTAVRLISGAVFLGAILLWKNIRSTATPMKIDPVGVLTLFIYAVCFSFAYLELATGTGALILFGAVQFTMLTATLLKGERLSSIAWAGIVIALVGMIYLLLPGISTPSWQGALLMGCSGVAWGIYSLRGNYAKSAVENTTWNFIGTVPLAIICLWIFMPQVQLSTAGILLGISSGAIASALGYIVWYWVLPQIKRSVAATVQLTVPLLAAIGGVIFMNEAISQRLIISAVATLGGIGLIIAAKEKQVKTETGNKNQKD